MTGFIQSLNQLNTPWVAIIVIVLGMCFDLTCKIYGVPNDAATGVIGAGIGLLTGQALSSGSRKPDNPAQPVDAQGRLKQNP